MKINKTKDQCKRKTNLWLFPAEFTNRMPVAALPDPEVIIITVIVFIIIIAIFIIFIILIIKSQMDETAEATVEV